MTKTDLKIHTVDELDRGLAYGEACFETFRVIDSEVLMLERHLARLTDGLTAFGIRLAEDDLSAIADTLFASARQCGDDVLLRLTVSGGTAAWGLTRQAKPEAYIQCMPFEKNAASIELVTTEWPFEPQQKNAKFTSDYALLLRALYQWNVKPPATPLICKNGLVLSASTANVIILRDGQWLTPDDAGGGVLPGVVRSLLIEKGVVDVANCPVQWLDDCEAILLTNSSGFAMPVASVNGRKLDPEHLEIVAVHELLRMFPGVEL